MYFVARTLVLREQFLKQHLGSLVLGKVLVLCWFVSEGLGFSLFLPVSCKSLLKKIIRNNALQLAPALCAYVDSL